MAKKLSIGMYSPYVPEHVGGGERYFFSVAAAAAKKHKVVVLTRAFPGSPLEWKQKYERAFGMDLSAVEFRTTVLGGSGSIWEKLRETQHFDVMYYLTDGSLFFSLARRNILHIQFPFTFAQTGLINRFKLANWQCKNANSEFTKKIVEKAWGVKIPFVHYPSVDTSIYQPAKKEQIILHVGRFFTGVKSKLHCKRQDVLVDAFKRLCDAGKCPGWRLVLVGSIDPGADNAEYARQVELAAKGYPVKILHYVTAELLQRYYAHAAIYWHATGFNVDETLEPTRVEHFGISVVEAMASGAVPVVVAKGGLVETVQPHKSGFLWNTLEELQQYTANLMEQPQLCAQMAVAARERAKEFSPERFSKVLDQMLRG